MSELNEKINQLGREYGYFWSVEEMYEPAEDKNNRQAFVSQVLDAVIQSLPKTPELDGTDDRNNGEALYFMKVKAILTEAKSPSPGGETKS
jgi:hypothetical protein